MKVQQGYQEWISEPVRAKSPELDFGCWWKLYPDDPPAMPQHVLLNNQPVTTFSAASAGRWRVSYVDSTGELYARHLAHNSDLFVVLGHFPTREAVEERMKGWAEGGAKVLTGWFGDDAYRAWRDAAKMLLDVCGGDEELATQVLRAMQEKQGREKNVSCMRKPLLQLSSSESSDRDQRLWLDRQHDLAVGSRTGGQR